jgi:stage V sporulation protein S
MQFKVSAKSDPRKVATAIISTLAETPSVTLNAIGAAAVNQAIKAAAIAGKHIEQEIICLPKFKEDQVCSKICTILQIEIKRAA